MFNTAIMIVRSQLIFDEKKKINSTWEPGYLSMKQTVGYEKPRKNAIFVIRSPILNERVLHRSKQSARYRTL